MGNSGGVALAADATLMYDPTNGTISTGDTYRLGP